MAGDLSTAPVLSTPAEHAFEQTIPADETETQTPSPKTDDELSELYEVARTAREIREGSWKRIALQFPDSMLRDAPRVVQALNGALESLPKPTPSDTRERIYILADTSYSACCVDEIAAEHADADAVVHYGRSCLSPTSRLPVIYVFTHHHLDHDETLAAFEKEYPDKDARVVLMADVTYQDHIPALASALHARGYTNLVSTTVVHDPTAPIPNRKFIPASSSTTPSPDGTTPTPDPAADLDLKSHSIFHISTPPTALLLALSSRVQALHIHPTPSSSSSPSSSTLPPSTTRLLGRRYARLLHLASAGVIGILVNTLSVASYRASVDALRARIAAAGKKSYVVVVGKVNPAKLANFAEVDGWVVVGCWESGLVEEEYMAGGGGGGGGGGGEFYKPVVTPFELGVALVGDEKRVWTGEWWGGIEGLVGGEGRGKVGGVEVADGIHEKGAGAEGVEDGERDGDEDFDEDESAPPEFDLRTGKLVSNSRPMRNGMTGRRTRKAVKPDGGATDAGDASSGSNGTLALRPKAELAMVNGVVSPGAEYLRSQRTWQGLGSDHVSEASTAIEEGRSGVARGYTVGEDQERR